MSPTRLLRLRLLLNILWITGCVISLVRRLEPSLFTSEDDEGSCFDFDIRPAYDPETSPSSCDLCEGDVPIWFGYAVCLSGYSFWRLCSECEDALTDGHCECVGCGETMMKA